MEKLTLLTEEHFLNIGLTIPKSPLKFYQNVLELNPNLEKINGYLDTDIDDKDFQELHSVLEYANEFYNLLTITEYYSVLDDVGIPLLDRVIDLAERSQTLLEAYFN